MKIYLYATGHLGATFTKGSHRKDASEQGRAGPQAKLTECPWIGAVLRLRDSRSVPAEANSYLVLYKVPQKAAHDRIESRGPALPTNATLYSTCSELGEVIFGRSITCALSRLLTYEKGKGGRM